MKLQIVCSKCIIFTLPENELIGKEEINKIVHSIQQKNSMPIWNNIAVDVYSCSKESLYFVYPETKEKIYLASYALPYLSEYFTE